jgi:hypothetical protein
MEYTNMSIIIIVKYFKQIAMRVKPQADIAIIGVSILKRTVITGIGERMVNIGFAYTVPKSRLLECNFNAHLSNIADMRNGDKAFRCPWHQGRSLLSLNAKNRDTIGVLADKIL